MKLAAICILFFSVNILPQAGFITGTVTDSRTKELLPGANIVVNELENTGAAAGSDGKFMIKVPVGSYSAKISLIGYRTVIKTDIIVKTGKEVILTVELSPESLLLDEVSVKADYFDRAKLENSVSTIILGAEEVKRSPGSLQDFQRILQSIAGVSFSKDKTNELLVRGGSPDENLTVLDNIEIHSTNHFPNIQNSAGPINMVNVDLVDDIRFSTGGFISKYGDKLSSVINITSREGSRTKTFKMNLNLSNAGVGTIMEGAVNGGKGSWLISLRKSYTDLVKNAIGLSSAPEYYDMQLKLAYDFSLKHKFTVTGIYGNDKLFDDGDSDNSSLLLAGKSDSVSIYKEDIKQYQYAAGTSLKSIWSNSLYSVLTVYYSRYHYNNSEIEKFVARKYDNSGEVVYSDVLKNKTEYEDISTIGSLGAKGELTWNAGWNELEFGTSVKTDEFNRQIYTGGDSSRYDILLDGWDTPDDIYIRQSSSVAFYNTGLFIYYKTYLFVNDKLSLFNNRMIFNVGLRYDYYSYNNKANLSPRISASYNIIKDINDINFSYGEYYQSQNYAVYNDRFHADVNRYLDNTHARHFVAGYNHMLDEGLKLTVEGYIKRYDDIPVKEEFIHYDDRTFRSEKYINAGRQIVKGIDILLQQKLVKNYYGTIAYSFMQGRMDDPRNGKKESVFPSDYEYPHIFTIVFGRRFSSLRQELDKTPFYIKYPSYLLPFSNDMEISARWRYASGRVYTPRTFVTTEQFFEGESRWSRGNWISSDERNSRRYPDYHRLDLSFSSRYNFERWSLTVYLSIENIYNRKNVSSYKYNSDGTKETSYQYSFLPVLGIEAEL